MNRRSALISRRAYLQFLMALFVGLILITMPATAPAEEGFAANFTDEQLRKIEETTNDFHRRQYDLVSKIQMAYHALIMELQRPDAFKDEMTAKASSANYKKLVRELGELVGQMFQARTDYLLAIKDVLTPEQKRELIYQVDFDVEPEKEIRIYFDVDMDELLGGFTPEQTKKLLKLQHDYEVRMAELTLAIDNLEVDIREEFLKAEPDSKKMRAYLKEITELNIQMLNAAVDYSLDTKDVLTNEQKQRLRHFFLTVYEPDILRD